VISLIKYIKGMGTQSAQETDSISQSLNIIDFFQYPREKKKLNRFLKEIRTHRPSYSRNSHQRINELNSILNCIVGFNKKLGLTFSAGTSTVICLEHEDLMNPGREKIGVFVNLGDFDPSDSLGSQQWNKAVNMLSEVVSCAGLKPKYIKNDGNNFVFTMRQYLLSSCEKVPDEFFTFELRYTSSQSNKALIQQYIKVIRKYDFQILKHKRKLSSWFLGTHSKKKLSEKIHQLEYERNFYIGTKPDPREIGAGLILSVSANTLQNYAVTRDKIHKILGRYIQAVSS